MHAWIYFLFCVSLEIGTFQMWHMNFVSHNHILLWYIFWFCVSSPLKLWIDSIAAIPHMHTHKHKYWTYRMSFFPIFSCVHSLINRILKSVFVYGSFRFSARASKSYATGINKIFIYLKLYLCWSPYFHFVDFFFIQSKRN